MTAGTTGHPDDNGGWRKNVGMGEWLDLHWDEYPGWDRDGKAELYGVTLTIVAGKDRKAYQIACEWDDLAEGWFHWSERHAEEGCFFLRAGDTYYAYFHFQTRADRDKFHARYGRVTS